MRELGVYIHIPFCKQKCSYCDFISYSNKNNFIEKYIEVLRTEITESLKKIDFTKNRISTIYIGGGTPSYIDSRYIINVLKNLKDTQDTQDTEITIEINPGTVTKEKLQEYFNIGINRLSIGLQATNNKLLNTIGRIHTYEEFLETYNLAREVGFKNINIDLMIGLPLQTLVDVEEDLKNIIELKPEHISVYSLILEEGTKLEQKIKNKELALPDEDLEREMYWTVKRELENNEFRHYEISNFAKLNYESKHNWNCWEQKEYIGFGVAAHSYIKGMRYSNASDIEQYITEYEKKEIHEIQDKEIQMKEFMLLGLRKIEGLKVSDFKNKFVENPIYVFRDELQKLEKAGLIEIDADNIKLTNRGIDLANLVWEEFV